MARPRPLPRIDGRGVIDMHIHIGPELIPRRYGAATLAEEARREGIGVVMKNHYQPTTALVAMVRRPDDAVPVVGSVTLNYGCGGIDDHGIRSALSGWKSDVTGDHPDPERFVVWMPTFCAEAHLASHGRQDIPLNWSKPGDPVRRYSKRFPEGTGLSTRGPDGRPGPGLLRALDMIAEHDLVLATGHLSKDETVELCALARARGVGRIVMTHPLWEATRLDPEALSHLWRVHGAYAELCFVNLSMNGFDDLDIGAYVDVIRAVGPEGVILSSDLGQRGMMTMTEGLRLFFGLLQKEGVHADDIARMSVLNPHGLLFGEAPGGNGA